VKTRLPVLFLLASAALMSSGGCVSAYKQTIGNDTAMQFKRVFITDFNTAWQAVLEALKSNALDVSNREGGYLQTKWTDNTAEKNFTDSFGGADAYKKAQYRFRISVAKSFYNGKPSIKVTVQKEQLVQGDVLEGWTLNESDTIDENTLLYRIGRIIAIRTQLAKIEEDRTKKAIENSGF
jgi:hypothetical protein